MAAHCIVPNRIGQKNAGIAFVCVLPETSSSLPAAPPGEPAASEPWFRTLPAGRPAAPRLSRSRRVPRGRRHRHHASEDGRQRGRGGSQGTRAHAPPLCRPRGPHAGALPLPSERIQRGHSADIARTQRGHGADTARTQRGHRADTGRAHPAPSPCSAHLAHHPRESYAAHNPPPILRHRSHVPGPS